jgi:hypothetical protein
MTLSFISCHKDELQSENLIVSNNSLEIIKNDMILPHEGVLNGVPLSYDWSSNPRLSWGNNPPSDWFAMIPWGQIYRDTNPIIVTNTRIQIKNLQAWYLNQNNVWIKWFKTSDIFGKHYLEDFQNDTNIPAQIRQEASGGISIKFIDGYNFHFWPTIGRTTINPNDIKGVWVCVEARLILDNSNGIDDTSQANFLCGVGGDYWKNLTVNWDNFQSSGDIGIGRMKYLSKDWKSFNMHTLDTELINSYPPPYQ